MEHANIIAHAIACDKAENSIGRRAAIKTAAAIIATAALPAIAAATVESDPLPDLVAQFVPLYEKYQQLHHELERRYERQDQLGHHRFPIYGYYGRETIVYEGNTSGIKTTFNQLIDDLMQQGSRLFTVGQIEWRQAYYERERDHHIKKALEFWEEWRQQHEDLGLAQLERDARHLEEIINPIENTILESRPTTLRGALALLRYALAYDYRPLESEEDQPPPSKSLATVIAFLEPLVTTGGAA